MSSPIGTRDNAVTTPNRYVDVDGRRLAYRSIGSGKPFVLCTRFRGNMDVWDPAFLDALLSSRGGGPAELPKHYATDSDWRDSPPLRQRIVTRAAI